MHVPDHLISNGTEVVAGVTAAAVLGATTVGLRRSTGSQGPADRSDGPTLLDAPDRLGPQLATAALVFALQMVNFPVLAGTSGHLMGGALATALIGPRRALLAVSSVVVAQALVFADGGTAALGINLWLIAILPVAMAALARRALQVRTADGARFWSAVAVGAVAGPAVSSLAFAGLYGLGAASRVPVGEVATSMLSVHLFIGLGEAAMTVAAVALLARARGTVAVWVGAAGAACGLALLASSAPDGLERVTGDLGMAVTGPGSLLSNSPLADYAVRGLDGSMSTVTAGLAGLVAAAAVAAALALATRSTTRDLDAAVTP